jgi:hypothetical protein
MQILDSQIEVFRLCVRINRLRYQIVRDYRMTPSFKGLGSALAKLKHDLDLQSGPLMADIESLATEAPALLKQATQEVAKTKQAVSDIKDFVSGLLSNGAPTSTDSSDTSAASVAATATVVDSAASAATVAEPAASWSAKA